MKERETYNMNDEMRVETKEIGYCETETTYTMYDDGITCKTIIRSKYHPVTKELIGQKYNLWTSVDGYEIKEF